MFNQEREEICAQLPQGDLSFGGPMPNMNAYVCINNGVVHIYPHTGGWLGMKIDDVRADIAPWSD